MTRRRRARPGEHAGAGGLRASPIRHVTDDEVGSFAPLLDPDDRKQRFDVACTLERLSRRSIDLDEAWEALREEPAIWPVSSLKMNDDGSLFEELPSGPERVEEKIAHDAVRDALELLAKRTERIRGTAFSPVLDDLRREWAHSASRRGLRDRVTIKGGRQYEPYSEDSPCSVKLAGLGIGSRVRLKLLTWARAAHRTGRIP